MQNLNLNIIIYPFIAFFSILGIVLNKEKKFYKYLVIILTFLSMVRFDTGFDYYWYYAVSKYEYMNNPRIHVIYENLEPGIKKIIDLARYLKHPQYFFMITGLITFGLIYYTIYRESKSPLLSLAFFMFLEMGFFRGNELVMQYSALSICFFSIKFAYNKQYIKYIFYILFASYFFHNSAIVCLMFIFIPKIRVENYIWFIYTIFCFMFLGKLLPILVEFILPQYIYLFNFSNESIYGYKDIKMSLILIILLFLIDLKLKNPFIKIQFENKKNIYIKNIFYVGSILAFSLAYFYKGHTGFRVGIYFMIYYLVLVGEYSSYLNLKISKFFKIGVILFLNMWYLKGFITGKEVFLNKNVHYNESGKLVRRPNSSGFKIFFNKKEDDMHKYIPGFEKEFTN